MAPYGTLRRIRLTVALAMVSGAIGACVGAHEKQADVPETIRVAVPGSVDGRDQRGGVDYGPLLDYLSDQVGLPFVMVSDSTTVGGDILALAAADSIDLVHVGAATFKRLSMPVDWVPLARRDIDAEYISYFVVGAESRAGGLDDLRGKRLGFSTLTSMSSHYIGRYHLVRRGIEPERYFSEVLYLSSMSGVLDAIMNDAIDVGVVSFLVWDNLLSRSPEIGLRLRVLEHTDPYVNYVLAAHPRIPLPVRARILDALLSLTPTDSVFGNILSAVGAGSFMPAGAEDFVQVDFVDSILADGGTEE